jgi:hypothetical protein
MPGKKDYVAVKLGVQKKHKQKRPVLNSLSEVHAEFRSHIVVSRLGSRNKHLCNLKTVIAGASGTLSVCVCVPLIRMSN